MQQLQHQAAVCIERRTDLTQINELMGWLLYVVNPVIDPSNVVCGALHASRGQSARSAPRRSGIAMVAVILGILV
jgi:hypothetical protein